MKQFLPMPNKPASRFIGFIINLLAHFSNLQTFTSVIGGEIRIDIFDSYRTLQHIVVQSGDTVTWMGRGQDTVHIVESFSAEFKSRPLNQNDAEFSYTFRNPGYHFYRVLSFSGPPPYETSGKPWRDLGSVKVSEVINPAAIVINAPVPGTRFSWINQVGSLDNLSEPISIWASAATNQPSEIMWVEFYSGERMLDLKVEPPYSLIWRDAPPGNHVLTARLLRNDGTVAVSPPVSVKVVEAPVPYSHSARLLSGGLFAFDYVIPPFSSGIGYFVHVQSTPQIHTESALQIKNVRNSGTFVTAIGTNQNNFFHVRPRY